MAKIDPIDGDFNDKELDINNILDFPIESLEGDDDAEDWDVSKFQSLGGPIPSYLLESSVLPLDNISSPKPPARQSAEASDPSSVRRRVGSHQSPVSVLCNTSQIRKAARSKRAKPVRNPWLSALPVVIAALAYKKMSSRRAKNPSSSSSKRANQPSSIDQNGSSVHPNDRAKMCSHCQSTETPQWREGPMGPQTLCNACGVRYRTGRLFPEYRPANSPSFVPSFHSNCHKKVMEMRKRDKEFH